LLDAKRESQQSQDTRDRAKADAGLKKELQARWTTSTFGGWRVRPASPPALALGLRRVESVGELIALGLDTTFSRRS